MFCGKCGAEVVARYCPECGNDVNPGYSGSQSQYNQNVKKSNMGLIVIVSIVGIVALAVVILFLFNYISEKMSIYDDRQKTPDGCMVFARSVMFLLRSR